MTSCFIRGNTIRYIHFNINDVDYQLIEEARRFQEEKRNQGERNEDKKEILDKIEAGMNELNKKIDKNKNN